MAAAPDPDRRAIACLPFEAEQPVADVVAFHRALHSGHPPHGSSRLHRGERDLRALFTAPLVGADGLADQFPKPTPRSS